MYLDDLIPAPTSSKVASVANKVFGYTLDLESLTPEKAKKLQESFTNRISHLDKKMGAKAAGNKIYLESKLFLEAIDKFIAENEVDDAYAMRELELYSESNGDLYRQSYVPIAKNLSKKFKKGVYDSELAKKLWKYHADRAAQKYGMENAGGAKDGLRMFSPDTRRAVAASLEDSWKSEMEAGNFMESSEVTESVITEGELENAELVLAAKDMVDKIQGMVEDLGEMQNEQLGPLTDAIRDEMGTDVADQFKGAMESVIVNALEGMRQSRDAAEQSSRILQGEMPAPMMGDEPAMDDPMSPEDPAMEPTMDMDMEQPTEEDFAAADAAQAGDEELGRERRE